MRKSLWVSAAVALVAISYWWAWHGHGVDWSTTQPPGYYGLLTDALLDGQLHLKRDPDPRLATLANPWAGAQDIPRLHDATYFNGRYYLYFGVSPVILLFGPWHLLMRSFLTEGAAITLFSFVGFLLGVRLWLRLQRSWFPASAPTWTVFGVLMIGLGNHIFFLLQTPAFYHVPITCAYMCLMAAFNAVELALTAPRTGRQALYLGLASLAWGLAIGARPNYLLSLPALMLPTWILWKTAGQKGGFKNWEAVRLLFWAIVPAGVIGAALAWYNYMRFGSILEFGVKYQFAASDQRFVKLTDWPNFPSTLVSYLTEGANYLPYFPFATPRADTIGVLVWAPFAALAVFFPLTLLSPDRRKDQVWSVLGLAMLASVPLNLFSLCLLPFANDRYVADFVPTATILAVAVVALIFAQTKRWPFVARAVPAICLSALAGFTLIESVMLGLQRQRDKATQHTAAVITDFPARWWEKWTGTGHGSVKCDIVFSGSEPGYIEPLIATSFDRDLIYVVRDDQTHLRFGFFHEGSGGPIGNPVEIQPGKKYRIEIDLGSLYPPNEHPAYRGWDESLIDALHRRVEVRLDGATVLHWISPFYPSSPFLLRVGQGGRMGGLQPKLQATVSNLTRGGIPVPNNVVQFPGNGPMRLTVKFPPFTNVFGQPLISTGRPGLGDLFYVTYLGPNRLRFGHDSWEYGNVESGEVEYDPEKEHAVDVDLGSLHAPVPGQSNDNQLLQVRFDGKSLISTRRHFNPSKPVDIAVGYNATGCSTASNTFTGPLLRAERIPNMKPPEASNGWGAYRITAKLPSLGTLQREPIVVTGRIGKGDFIYVVYIDNRHIRVGHDHWGTGTKESELIEIAPDRPTTFTVEMASLYPPENAPEWENIARAEQTARRSGTRVQVNGKPALESAFTAFDANKDDVYLGQNPLGGSSCTAVFTGTILTSERMDLAATEKKETGVRR